MKIFISICFFIFVDIQLVLADEESSSRVCERIVSNFANMDVQKLKKLYEFYFHNKKQWRVEISIKSTHFILEPKKKLEGKLSWSIKQQNSKSAKSSGSIKCEIPTQWQLELKNSIEIVYPKVMERQCLLI
jgi:hypothetical protein